MRLEARWLSVCVLVLGCGPSPEPSTPVVSKDRVERSEPDAGQEEDATPDLAALLFKTGDLASGFAAGEPSDTAPGMFAELPKADAVVSVPFMKQAEQAGGITAFGYKDVATRDQAFARVAKGMKPIPGKAVVKRTDEVGEQAIIGLFKLAGDLEAADVLFRRCSVIAHIRLVGENSGEDAVAYAKKLDRRISQSACDRRGAGSLRLKASQATSSPAPIKCAEAKELLTKLVTEFGPEGGEATVTDLGDLNGDGLNEYAGLFEHQVMSVSWVVSRTKDSCYREVFSQAPGSIEKSSSRSKGWVDLSVGVLLNRMGGLRMMCDVTMRARFDGSRYVLREVVRAEPSDPSATISKAECQKQAEGFLAKEGAK